MLKILTEPKNEFVQGSAVTIGNFDGMHRGHRALLERLQQLATTKHIALTIVLFEPQPQEFFQIAKAPARLTTWLEKIMALQAIFDADEIQGYILTLHFEAQLAALSANDFIHQVLLQQLHVKHLLVGSDFHFGSQRMGDVMTLQEDAKRHDYQVEVFPLLLWDGKRVSSTHIREALAKGNLSVAANLLGHPYTMTGVVIQGAQRGRTLGYPTANIVLGRSQAAVAGVFAIWVHGLAEPALPGIANIGLRPTVGGTQTCLEVHIFDFEQAIYDRQLTIEFVHFIRAEQKFASLVELKAQIAKDIEAAKNILMFKSTGFLPATEMIKASKLNDH